MIMLWAALALSTPSTAGAQPAAPLPAVAPAGARSTFREGVLSLAPDEEVVLRLAEDGSFVLVSAEPASDGAESDPAPGTVVFKMSHMMGTMLSVRSGLDKGFRYDAHFDARRRQRTSTCAVPAGLMGFENWGQAVSRLTLSNFRTVEDSELVCD